MSDTQTSRNPIWLIFKFLWGCVNFIRDVVLSILVLLLLFFILASFAKKTKPVLPGEAVLVVNPKGMIVEEYSGDALSRAMAEAMGRSVPETQLRDIVSAFDRAADDKRITHVLLVPHEIAGLGVASANEITAAMDRFRESGKKIITHAYGLEQKSYLLAAHSDEIYLHPEGAVLLEGLGRYRNYYKDGLQDKLGVNVHLFRVGEYKSAAEPFIRNDASPEAKEADLFWMNDIWQRMLVDIGKRRGISPSQLQYDADHFDEVVSEVHGDLAQYALKRKLVDGLKTSDEMRDMMLELGTPASDNEHTFEQISLKQYTSPLHAPKPSFDGDGHVGVVIASGEITGGEQKPGTVGGESTSARIREAREDDNIKALVLRVDSPGGGVFPSEQIRREVELTKAAGKPVVVSMGDVAASGGYWISMNADQIIADPSTITGSIGIFGLFMTTENTMDKIGVHMDGVGTTKMAGALNPGRGMQPMIANALQTVIEDGYDNFITKVAAARKMPVEAVDKVARGRVWSGAQAKEFGLVDRLGTLQDALAEAATRADLGEDFTVEYVQPKLTPFEEAFAAALQNTDTAQSMLGMGVSFGLIDHATQQQLSRELKMVQAAKQDPFAAFSYCFCEL